MKVGVIGIGSMGKNHVRVFNELNCEVLIADSKEGIIEEYMGSDLVLAGFADYKELLKTYKLDYVSICVPTPLHLEVFKEVANSGVKNIFLEKPIATTVIEADEIAKIARELDIFVSVGHIERYNPIINSLKSLLEGKKLIAAYFNRIGFFNRTIDVGVCKDLMVHDIDLIKYLFNFDIDYKQVRLTKVKRTESHLEDTAIATIIEPEQFYAVLNASYSSFLKRREILVLTETHTFKVDLIAKTISIFDCTNIAVDNVDLVENFIVNNSEESLKLELQDFLDKKSRITVEEATIALSLVS